MNRRTVLSLLGLAPVGAVAALPVKGDEPQKWLSAIVADETNAAPREIRWQARDAYAWPQTDETRQVITTHNVGQSDAYQTEHQIVFNGTEWVDA